MSKTCNKCNTINNTTSKFCQECGSKFKEEIKEDIAYTNIGYWIIFSILLAIINVTVIYLKSGMSENNWAMLILFDMISILGFYSLKHTDIKQVNEARIWDRVWFYFSNGIVIIFTLLILLFSAYLYYK